MDLFHILKIFPLKILDVTNGALYQFFVNSLFFEKVMRMWLLSLNNFNYGMNKDRINLSVYWVNIGTKGTRKWTTGALCLFVKTFCN